MKNVFEHVERIKGKPHHIRKQVAFGTAGALTGVVAIVWLVGSLSTGAFALKDNSFAQINVDEESSVVSGNSGGQVAGAAASGITNTRTPSPAKIQIIDAKSSVMTNKKAEQTTIPF